MVVFLILLALLFLVGFFCSHAVASSKKLTAWLYHVLPWNRFSDLPVAPVVEEAAVAPSVKKGLKEEVKVAPSKAAAEADKAELEKVFATFDSNGDGYITVQELEESLRKLGLFTTGSEVAGMVTRLDSNCDGLVDLEEFRQLYSSMGTRTAQQPRSSDEEGGTETEDEEGDEDEEMDMREAFDVFDRNGDGLITVEELGMVLRTLGMNQGATAASCREMIKRVDRDGDGMVSYDEFKEMMKGGKLL